MSKAAIAAVVAACLILAGVILFVVGFKMSGGDWQFPDDNEYYERSYSFSDEFSSVNAEMTFGDIKFVPCGEDEGRVECMETDRLRYDVSVKNNTLNIVSKNTKKINIIFFSFGTLSKRDVTVYLPKTEYEKLTVNTTSGDVEVPEAFTFGTVKIKTTSGDVSYCGDAVKELTCIATSGEIEIAGIHAKKTDVSTTSGDIDISDLESEGNVNLSSTSGDMDLTNVRCKRLDTELTSGCTKLKNVIADAIDCESVSGSIELTACDAKSLKLKAVSGSVSGELLTGKRYTASTVSGSVRVPADEGDETCDINTVSGNIRFK